MPSERMIAPQDASQMVGEISYFHEFYNKLFV